jgi:hypothetical protein
VVPWSWVAGIAEAGTVTHMAVLSSDRVCVVGDTHRRLDPLVEVLHRAADEGCARVLQVGDFGWYPGTEAGDEFAAGVAGTAAELGLVVAFIGGNHDNWDDLVERTGSAARDDDGFVVLGDHLRYVPRPHRWEWAGVRVGALGGAWSINWRRLVRFVSWWPNEEPSAADADALCAEGPLDVAVFHDAPGEVDLSVAAWDLDDASDGRGPRVLADMVVARCDPRLVFHGHWHHRHTTVLAGGARVEGLAHEVMRLTSRSVIWDLGSGQVWPAAAAEPTRAPWWPAV